MTIRDAFNQWDKARNYENGIIWTQVATDTIERLEQIIGKGAVAEIEATKATPDIDAAVAKFEEEVREKVADSLESAGYPINATAIRTQDNCASTDMLSTIMPLLLAERRRVLELEQRHEGQVKHIDELQKIISDRNSTIAELEQRNKEETFRADGWKKRYDVIEKREQATITFDETEIRQRLRQAAANEAVGQGLETGVVTAIREGKTHGYGKARLTESVISAAIAMMQEQKPCGPTAEEKHSTGDSDTGCLPGLPVESQDAVSPAVSFLKRIASYEGRIVTTNDLTELQICEAQRDKRMYVDSDGLGYVVLPWDLSTKKDKQREVSLFAKPCGPSAIDGWQMAKKAFSFEPHLEGAIAAWDSWWEENIRPASEVEKPLRERIAELEKEKDAVAHEHLATLAELSKVRHAMKEYGVSLIDNNDGLFIPVSGGEYEKMQKEINELKSKLSEAQANAITTEQKEILAAWKMDWEAVLKTVSILDWIKNPRAAILAAYRAGRVEKKPPIGLMPKQIHDEKRLAEIEAAIERYSEADKDVPVEWKKEKAVLEAEAEGIDPELLQWAEGCKWTILDGYMLYRYPGQTYFDLKNKIVRKSCSPNRGPEEIDLPALDAIKRILAAGMDPKEVV